MRKNQLIPLIIIVLIGAIVSLTWMNAYNGEVRMNNEVEKKLGDVHASLGSRYDKVVVFVDAIQGANETVAGYLNIIKESRVAFANALNNDNLIAANESAEVLDSTFVTLLAYMEDNPASYNTVNLTAGFMSEFSASTNVVLNAIEEYNETVRDYNNHIQQFPNNVFLGNKTTHKSYAISNYNAEFPTFK